MRERLHFEDNGQGWLLELRQYWSAEHLDATRRPIVMIPGYCMNTFILNFHPTRDSMVRYLTLQGHEVWTANLRGQGGSRRDGGSKSYGFRELALVDLPVVMEYVKRHAKSDAPDVDAIGCSLGATFLYAYLAHFAESHGVGSLTAIGGPLRWEASHPLVKLAFSSPMVAGLVNIRGTRHAARAALPIVQHMPRLLELYMNAQHIDLSQASELVRTIDDPVPYLNRQIAHWVKERDLKVAGLNITAGLRHIDIPTLCILANADGIVPPAAALSIQNAIGTEVVDILHVGDEENWFAHADLFINNQAPERVFEPLSAWIKKTNL